MKKLFLSIIVAIFLIAGSAIAEEGEYKTGWNNTCLFHAIAYCNNCCKESYNKCMEQERICGTEMFDIVYPKNVTESEMQKLNAELIALLVKNNVLDKFILNAECDGCSYCDLLTVVKEQWEVKK